MKDILVPWPVINKIIDYLESISKRNLNQYLLDQYELSYLHSLDINEDEGYRYRVRDPQKLTLFLLRWS